MNSILIAGLEYKHDTHSAQKYHGRNFLMEYKSGDSIDMEYQGLICSQNTFLSMIDLAAVMDPLVAFSVASDTQGSAQVQGNIYTSHRSLPTLSCVISHVYYKYAPY